MSTSTPTLRLASEVSPRVASEVAAIADLLTMASLDRVHVLRVETREGDPTTMRMRCACGRNSYFHPVTTADEAPAPVVAALSRHVDRAKGKALRVIKSDPRLAARLAALLAEDAPEGEVAEAPEGEAPSVIDAGDPDAPSIVRARIGRGAVAHLSADLASTLCGKEGDLTELPEDDERSTCRECAKLA